MTKILDMVPDIVNKFTSGKGNEDLTFDDIVDATDDAENEEK